MKQKKENFTEDFVLYEKGKEYNRRLGLYERVNQNERFYRGDQWHGIDSNGLPTPVFNIFKRIIGYFTSSVMQTPIKLRYTLKMPNSSDTEQSKQVSERLNAIAEMRWEKDKLDTLLSNALTDAAISGDAVAYTYWDSGIDTSQRYLGDFKTKLIDSVNVFLGDPNSKSIQSQPYVIIAQRETLHELKRQANMHGLDKESIEKIKPDGEFNDLAGNLSKIELENTKCISLIKLWRGENGNIFYRKSVKGVVLTPDSDLRIKRYPIAFFNWCEVKNSWHGVGVADGLIENQIFINKSYAMVMKHMMDTAFSKVVYDSTLLDGWSDRVGEAIAVNGPVESVAKVISPGVMQSGMLEVISMAIANTKEFMGATDAALGDVAPNNTSAILALQNASAVPLENVKRSLYQFVEDIGLIWLDFMFNYYADDRIIEQKSDNDSVFTRFDMSNFNSNEFYCKVDVGASSYWSEISALNTLDSLLKLGKISTIQYLERIPDGIIPKRLELIEEIRADIEAQKGKTE